MTITKEPSNALDVIEQPEDRVLTCPNGVGERKEKESISKMEKPAPTKKKKRFRSAFTTDQINALEAQFRVHPYITRERRKEISNEIQIKEVHIKTWFQNRRMREKNDKAAGYCTCVGDDCSCDITDGDGLKNASSEEPTIQQQYDQDQGDVNYDNVSNLEQFNNAQHPVPIPQEQGHCHSRLPPALIPMSKQDISYLNNSPHLLTKNKVKPAQNASIASQNIISSASYAALSQSPSAGTSNSVRTSPNHPQSEKVKKQPKSTNNSVIDGPTQPSSNQETSNSNKAFGLKNLNLNLSSLRSMMVDVSYLDIKNLEVGVMPKITLDLHLVRPKSKNSSTNQDDLISQIRHKLSRSKDNPIRSIPEMVPIPTEQSIPQIPQNAPKRPDNPIRQMSNHKFKRPVNPIRQVPQNASKYPDNRDSNLPQNAYTRQDNPIIHNYTTNEDNPIWQTSQHEFKRPVNPVRQIPQNTPKHPDNRISNLSQNASTWPDNAIRQMPQHEFKLPDNPISLQSNPIPQKPSRTKRTEKLKKLKMSDICPNCKGGPYTCICTCPCEDDPTKPCLCYCEDDQKTEPHPSHCQCPNKYNPIYDTIDYSPVMSHPKIIEASSYSLYMQAKNNLGMTRAQSTATVTSLPSSPNTPILSKSVGAQNPLKRAMPPVFSSNDDMLSLYQPYDPYNPPAVDHNSTI